MVLNSFYCRDCITNLRNCCIMALQLRINNKRYYLFCDFSNMHIRY